MGRIKQLLEQEWENLTRDQKLDLEYMEWAQNTQRPYIPFFEEDDSSITEQGL